MEDLYLEEKQTLEKDWSYERKSQYKIECICIVKCLFSRKYLGVESDFFFPLPLVQN